MTTVTYADCRGNGARTARGTVIDPATDESAARAKENVDYSIAFLASVFQRRDVPDFRCCINWGSRRANALWYQKKVMLGSGDNCHRSYTDSLSVIMHEITHSLTEDKLATTDVARTINEHLCDVFGILARQWRQSQRGEEPDWLFGSEIRICPGAAIRNLRVPREDARDPGAMTWPEASFPDDVYFNVGVLNRAFALASDSIPLPPWQSTGKIWHSTLGQLGWHMDIPGFVNLVIANAGEYEREVVSAFRAVEFDV
ncbi:MAG: M4 family metallopeptidase [Woeseiaceae bacterium]|nr:M4 family metallopeptidase [Woeseiaceae bacterium]